MQARLVSTTARSVAKQSQVSLTAMRSISHTSCRFRPAPSDTELEHSQLTHLHPANKTVRMVDLPATKPITQRKATAIATLVFSNQNTLELVRSASLEKGDVLAVSRIAGISASKQTSTLIPMCHNIPLSGTHVDIELVDPSPASGYEHGALQISATVKTLGQTGVEMDALTAASVAGLTAYDMCKAVDKGMTMTGVRVTRKEGGKSGTWVDGRRVVDEGKVEGGVGGGT